MRNAGTTVMSEYKRAVTDFQNLKEDFRKQTDTLGRSLQAVGSQLWGGGAAGTRRTTMRTATTPGPRTAGRRRRYTLIGSSPTRRATTTMAARTSSPARRRTSAGRARTTTAAPRTTRARTSRRAEPAARTRGRKSLRAVNRILARAAGGGRTPRGALKAAIHKVLAGGKAMRPAAVLRALPGTGFKSRSTPKVQYTTVYLALRKDRQVQKTPEGFRLKGPAR